MDPAAALADLTEISSQIESAAVIGEDGSTLAVTVAGEERAQRLARTGIELLEGAAGLGTASGRTPVHVEAKLPEGSVFVLRGLAPDRRDHGSRADLRARPLRPPRLPPLSRRAAAAEAPGAKEGVRVRRLLVLAFLVGGPLLYLSRRREAGRERLTVSYDDGSQVTIPDGAPGAERLLALARTALTA